MTRDFWKKLVPFMQWWPEVDRHTLRADAAAGLTGAIVVLPQGVAFAAIAGMPPEYGLYAAMVPTVLAALFGSSRLLVSGPSIPASIVLFATLAPLAPPGSPTYVSYALTLTFMVGALQLAMGAARMGTLVNFVSHSVIVGFTAGAALLIAGSQLQNFFGVHIPRGLHFHETVFHLLYRLRDIDPETTCVGVLSLATALGFRRYAARVPYMIPTLVVGTLLAAGIEFLTYAGFLHPSTGVSPLKLLGTVPQALPRPSMPDFSFSTFQHLASASLAVTLFALTQTMSIARSLAARSGELHDGNQEFVGQGLANVVGCFLSAYVSTGSINRSAINAEAGARTPIAAILSGCLLVVIVLAVAPAMAYMPNAAVAAILFVVAWGLVDFANIRKILKASRDDSIVLWTTFFATLFLPLDFAILLGVFLSLVIYLRQASRPTVLVRVPDPRLPGRRFNTDASLPECPQLALVRIDGALFFGAVNYVGERLRIIAKRNPTQRHLLILSRTISFLDVAGAEMLAREARLRRAVGGQLYFHALRERSRNLLESGGYLEEIGRENLFDTKGEAIASVFGRLDKGICARCEKRIFNECRTVPRAEEAKPAAQRAPAPAARSALPARTEQEPAD